MPRKLTLFPLESGASSRPPVPDPCPKAAQVGDLVSSDALHALLERGLKAIVALTGARGGVIRLVPPASGSMQLVCSVGLPSEILANELLVDSGCGMCGAALRTNDVQVQDGPVACARRMGVFAAGAKTGPMLAVPLHCRDRTIGVFNLFFGDSARLPADVMGLLGPVSEMLDLVLDNALLEQERLQTSLSSERQMFASEIHDSLAQGLAFMRMRMALLNDAIRAGNAPQSLKYFRDIQDSLGEAHAGLRELITHFRQPIDGQGLVHALENTALTFHDRTGVALRIENRARNLRLPAEQEAQVYQIVREALANVIKHAGASNARVVLDRTAKSFRVSVEDDGSGTRILRRRPGSAPDEHYGLEIMRERARRIGGRLRIVSAPGKGTQVCLSIPRESGTTD
ncbi:MAG: GAF domain-containing protein [Betaproteobacteria bacterium]|nr:GAF domain-containing protein [Betaproteobacteria bacterium]